MCIRDRDNPGLLMFYCSGFLKDCVYYSSAYDLACVATEEDVYKRQTLAYTPCWP